MAVIHDGQVYNDGDTLHDLGSFVLIDYDGDKRHYAGMSADIGKLPKYDDLAPNSTAHCIDTNDIYYYDDNAKEWRPGGKKGSGQGVPVGGTAGQVLVKKSGNDFDTEWTTPQAGGGAVVADTAPTQGSANPVQSGGVYNALEGKQNKVAGIQGQYVGFNAQGEAVAETLEYKKHVVIAIAGQSNAVGYDESRVDGNFLYKNRNPLRIKQLGYKNANNLQLIPLTHCAENVQDMTNVVNAGGTRGTKGLHLPLANLMLDYIPEDYGIIVIPVAQGSTGFTNGTDFQYNAVPMKPNTQGATMRWGSTSALYYTLRDRIKYALELNTENIFAGVIWIQGEDDSTNASGHITAFETMTELFFREMNDAGYGSRTPKGIFDKDIWYNLETVSYWYRQGQCQTIWDNYKAWNPKTYVEVPRTADSNEVGGNLATSQIAPSHFGNNAFATDVSPRVIQKMVEMNIFGVKNIGDHSSESIGSTYFPGVPVVTDGDRLLVQADLKTSHTTNTITVDGNGNCTLDANISNTLFGTSQSQVIFGDVSKIDFEVKRSLYWMVLERDYDANKFVMVGLGRTNTGKVVEFTVGANSPFREITPTSNNNKEFAVGDRIRAYRNTDGSVTIYHKAYGSTSYVKWFSVPAHNILKERALGFVCGIGVDEHRGNFTGELTALFNGMKIQTNTPYPNYQVSDIKISELEAKHDNSTATDPTAFPNTSVVTDGQRILVQDDLYTDTPNNVQFTITDGNCTLSRDISNTLFRDTKSQIIFGNLSMIDFEVKRSTYWLIIERDIPSQSLLLVGFGISFTKQITKIVGSQSTVVQNDPQTLNKTFGTGDRVRIYRNVDGSLTFYYKAANSDAYEKWFEQETYDMYPERVLGFACGLSLPEYSNLTPFSTNLSELFNGMKLQEETPYPNYQVSDIRIASLELKQANGSGGTGPQGPQGDAGPKGDPGVGVPTGGTTGQVLVKTSDVDYATEWRDPQAGSVGPQGPAGPTGPQGQKGDTGDAGQGVPTGGTTGQVLVKRSETDYDTEWQDAPTGGAAITVDDVMSDDSENPVQNKITKKYVDDAVIGMTAGSNFLTENGFGKLRYYDNKFQYYDDNTSDWVDTVPTLDNSIFIELRPLNVKKFITTCNMDTLNVEIKLVEPMDTVLDGQAFSIVEKVIVRRKKDSVPDNENDGDHVFTVYRNEFGKYEDKPFIDVVNGDIDDVYYYKAFPVSTQGVVNYAEENNRKCKIARYQLYGFRIDQNESDPSTMIQYLEGVDNTYFTPAYMDYENDVFNYGDWKEAWFIENLKPCMLNYDGTVAYVLNKDDYTLKEDGSPSDITDENYSGNVMIGFPKIYWKIIDNGDDTADVFISNKKLDEDYVCWCNINEDGEEIDYFYVGAYNVSYINGVIRCLSEKTMEGSRSMTSFIERTQSNNPNDKKYWNIELFVDRILINLLLLLIGKSADTQTVFGKGIASYGGTTGTLNKKGLFYGKNTGDTIKVFGIENYWGNYSRFTLGLIIASGVLKIKLTHGTFDGSTAVEYNTTGSGYISLTGLTVSSTGYISKMHFTNNIMIPKENAGSSSTKYCDYFTTPTSGTRVATFSSPGADNTGAFNISLNASVSSSSSSISSGISCKPLNTTP